MKTLSLLPACIAATLFIVPLSKAADATPAPAAASSSEDAATSARQAEILKRFDKNGDGKLDETEKAEAKKEMQKHRAAGGGKLKQRALLKYDKNGDGVLDAAERAAALADLENRPRFVKRFDTDGDGKLNAEEKAAADRGLELFLSEAPGAPATPPAAPSASK